MYSTAQLNTFHFDLSIWPQVLCGSRRIRHGLSAGFAASLLPPPQADKAAMVNDASNGRHAKAVQCIHTPQWTPILKGRSNNKNR